jgi:hypothetical protein
LFSAISGEEDNRDTIFERALRHLVFSKDLRSDLPPRFSSIRRRRVSRRTWRDSQKRGVERGPEKWSRMERV